MLLLWIIYKPSLAKHVSNKRFTPLINYFSNTSIKYKPSNSLLKLSKHFTYTKARFKDNEESKGTSTGYNHPLSIPKQLQWLILQKY